MLYFSKKVVHPETRYLRWIMTRWQTEENNYHSFWFMQVMLHFNSSNSKEFSFISFQSKNNYYYSIMYILKHYSLILWCIVIYKRISKKARKKNNFDLLNFRLLLILKILNNQTYSRQIKGFFFLNCCINIERVDVRITSSVTLFLFFSSTVLQLLVGSGHAQYTTTLEVNLLSELYNSNYSSLVRPSATVMVRTSFVLYTINDLVRALYIY